MVAIEWLLFSSTDQTWSHQQSIHQRDAFRVRSKILSDFEVSRSLSQPIAHNRSFNWQRSQSHRNFDSLFQSTRITRRSHRSISIAYSSRPIIHTDQTIVQSSIGTTSANLAMSTVSTNPFVGVREVSRELLSHECPSLAVGLHGSEYSLVETIQSFDVMHQKFDLKSTEPRGLHCHRWSSAERLSRAHRSTRELRHRLYLLECLRSFALDWFQWEHLLDSSDSPSQIRFHTCATSELIEHGAERFLHWFLQSNSEICSYRRDRHESRPFGNVGVPSVSNLSQFRSQLQPVEDRRHRSDSFSTRDVQLSSDESLELLVERHGIRENQLGEWISAYYRSHR